MIITSWLINTNSEGVVNTAGVNLQHRLTLLQDAVSWALQWGGRANSSYATTRNAGWKRLHDLRKEINRFSIHMTGLVRTPIIYLFVSKKNTEDLRHNTNRWLFDSRGTMEFSALQEWKISASALANPRELNLTAQRFRCLSTTYESGVANRQHSQNWLRRSGGNHIIPEVRSWDLEIWNDFFWGGLPAFWRHAITSKYLW